MTATVELSGEQVPLDDLAKLRRALAGRYEPLLATIPDHQLRGALSALFTDVGCFYHLLAGSYVQSVGLKEPGVPLGVIEAALDQLGSLLGEGMARGEVQQELVIAS